MRKGLAVGLRDEGLRAFGAWEPLAIRLRAADDPRAVKDTYDWEHTEEFIKGLKERGFNLYITHFSKGYGIEAEAESREDTRRVADLCHKHGMYVGGYIRYTTFIPETMAAEIPDCVERFGGWNSLGKRTRYNKCDWRYMPCPTSSEWLEYIDRVIEIGVRDIGLDCLHVDGVSLRPEPYACHCERCRARFSERLRACYPDAESQMARFGFVGVDHIEPPDFTISHHSRCPLPVIHDTIAQEWMFFRCHLLGEIWKFIVDAARSRNPEIVVQGNSSFSPQVNGAWFGGARLSDLARAGSDGLFSEEGMAADLTPDGRLHGYFETFKKMRRIGIQVFAYNRGPDVGQIGDPEKMKRSIAHHMAFNRDAAGVFCGRLAPGEWPASARDYLTFHRDRRDLFRDATQAHDVAIYYSEPTLALNCGEPRATLWNLATTLLRGHTPFGYMLETRREEMKEFRAVALPETECVSEAEADDIAGYVKQGGGLLIVGASAGRFDALRRAHRESPLMAALDLEWDESTPAFTAHVGEGRVAFLPRIVTPQGASPDLVAQAVSEPIWFHVCPDQWQTPINAMETLDMLRWAADGFRYEIVAPDTVVAEFTRQGSPPRELVHLVNFDVEREVGAFEVTLHGRSSAQVRAFTPDGDPPAVDVRAGAHGAPAVVRVAGFHRYLVLTIEG